MFFEVFDEPDNDESEWDYEGDKKHDDEDYQ